MENEISKYSWIRCGRKRRYENVGSAVRVAKLMSKRTGGWLIAYECIDCGGWHVGKASYDQEIVRQQPKRMAKDRCNYCGKVCHGVYCDVTCRKNAGKS
jgi:hypothetical protein